MMDPIARLQMSDLVDPVTVGFVDAERFRRTRGHTKIAALQGCANAVLDRGTGEILYRIAVVRQKGVEEHDRAYSRGHLFGNPRNYESTIRVTAQHHVAHPLPFDHVY